MRHIFIGDVHGMLDELNTLLDKLELREDDRIVFVGDLLDKGPDSAGVVNRVRTLASSNEVTLVMGNHEDTHSRYRKHCVSNISTAESMAERKPELPAITAQLTPEDTLFLDTAVLFHRVPSCNIIVVHGGIPGSQRTLPDSLKELEGLSNNKLKPYKLLMRTRHVDANTGNFVGLGNEKPDDPYWADIYDGRFGHIIFGHQPFMNGVKYFKHATGIDTGAVFGGTLTALIVSDDCSRSVVSVKSRAFQEIHDFMNK